MTAVTALGSASVNRGVHCTTKAGNSLPLSMLVCEALRRTHLLLWKASNQRGRLWLKHFPAVPDATPHCKVNTISQLKLSGVQQAT